MHSGWFSNCFRRAEGAWCLREGHYSEALQVSTWPLPPTWWVRGVRTWEQPWPPDAGAELGAAVLAAQGSTVPSTWLLFPRWVQWLCAAQPAVWGVAVQVRSGAEAPSPPAFVVRLFCPSCQVFNWHIASCALLRYPGMLQRLYTECDNPVRATGVPATTFLHTGALGHLPPGGSARLTVPVDPSRLPCCPSAVGRGGGHRDLGAHSSLCPRAPAPAGPWS